MQMRSILAPLFLCWNYISTAHPNTGQQSINTRSHVPSMPCLIMSGTRMDSIATIGKNLRLQVGQSVKNQTGEVVKRLLRRKECARSGSCVAERPNEYWPPIRAEFKPLQRLQVQSRTHTSHSTARQRYPRDRISIVRYDVPAYAMQQKSPSTDCTHSTPNLIGIAAHTHNSTQHATVTASFSVFPSQDLPTKSWQLERQQADRLSMQETGTEKSKYSTCRSVGFQTGKATTTRFIIWILKDTAQSKSLSGEFADAPGHAHCGS